MGCSDVDDCEGLLFISTVIFCVLFGKGLYDAISAVSVTYVLVGLGIYVAIGIVWTIIKWWLHCRSINAEIKNFEPSVGVYLGSGRNSAFLQGFKYRLDPTKNKSRITTWGVYWPWSMLWSAIRDSVDAAYEALLNSYRRIAKGSLAEVEALEASLPKSDK